MKFTKLQGAGNDFILVEASELNRDWSQMAVAMCDRHLGIGADGLLVLWPSHLADFQMHIFNPDGSEAEACGNGLRCLAKYVVDKGLLSRKIEEAKPLENLDLYITFKGERDKKGEVDRVRKSNGVDKEFLGKGLADTETQEISVETVAGIRKVKLHYEGKFEGGEVVRIQVGMGQPKFGAKDIPVVIEPKEENLVDIKSMLSYSITIGGRELLLNFVSMGNPHAIYFWQYPVSDFPLSQLGPEVEQHKMFPNRVNFEVANVISRQQIEARVWERGVGETLACGTGACAVAVAAQLLGYIDNKVGVKLPGGILDVEWDRVGEVSLGGPAEIVFTGEWSK